MIYSNTKIPDLTIKGKAAWCLGVTQDVWGVPHMYNTPPANRALNAWADSIGYNHPDELPPSGIYSIGYWSYTDPTDQQVYWHIATILPDGRVYSSPFDSAYGSQIFDSVAAMTERINKIDPAAKYIGWSQSLSNVVLVKKEYVLNDQTIMWAWVAAYGVDPSKEDFDFWRGKDPEELLHALAEGNQLLRWKAGQYESLSLQLSAITAKAADLAKNPTKEVFDQLQKQIGECNIQIANAAAEKQTVEKTADTFLQIIGKLIKKYIPGL